MPTTVLIADDHPTFRLGLKQVIVEDPAFSVVAEASGGLEALDRIFTLNPDLAVVDWDMPGLDGLEVIRRVTASSHPIRLVMLTMHDGESLVNEVVEAGVHGFVLKDHAVEDILDCLRAVRDGGFYLSPAVAPHVMRKNQQRAALWNRHPGLEILTPAERRVLALVAEKKSTREIAAELSVSPRTIDTHRRNICEKLSLTGSHSLLQFARQHAGSLPA